jgi:myo-inositol-1(or 4)-monophosphatase
MEVMMDAARSAAAGLLSRFRDRDSLTVCEKGPANFVSTADLESDRLLRELLLGTFPTFGYVSEESAPVESSESNSCFVVDPLDGTTNFLWGIPHFAVSVALVRDGRPVAGVVFDPAKDEMFTAELGRGAWLDSKPMRVSSDGDLAHALIATGIPHAHSRLPHEPYLAMLRPAMRAAAGIRRLGAAALDLAYVAAGRYSVFFEQGLYAWDTAAGVLLVTEAGGVVSDISGGTTFLQSGRVLATNGRLHRSMLSMFASARRTHVHPRRVPATPRQSRGTRGRA